VHLPLSLPEPASEVHVFVESDVFPNCDANNNFEWQLFYRLLQVLERSQFIAACQYQPLARAIVNCRARPDLTRQLERVFQQSNRVSSRSYWDAHGQIILTWRSRLDHLPAHIQVLTPVEFIAWFQATEERAPAPLPEWAQIGGRFNPLGDPTGLVLVFLAYSFYWLLHQHSSPSTVAESTDPPPPLPGKDPQISSIPALPPATEHPDSAPQTLDPNATLNPRDDSAVPQNRVEDRARVLPGDSPPRSPKPSGAPPSQDLLEDPPPEPERWPPESPLESRVTRPPKAIDQGWLAQTIRLEPLEPPPEAADVANVRTIQWNWQPGNSEVFDFAAWRFEKTTTISQGIEQAVETAHPSHFSETSSLLNQPPNDGQNISQPLPQTDSLYQSGVFTVGVTGQVQVNYLLDGGAYEGELGLFSLAGLESLQFGSVEFDRAVIQRVLSNSALGGVAISDGQEGAQFSGALPWEDDFNRGAYAGVKTFSMRPGDRFGLVLLPNGTFQQWADAISRPNPDGANRQPPLLFSLEIAGLNPPSLNSTLADVTGQGRIFGMEDVRLNAQSDRDYNDMVFQLEGATGAVPPLDALVNPQRDWRSTVVGQSISNAGFNAGFNAGGGFFTQGLLEAQPFNPNPMGRSSQDGLNAPLSSLWPDSRMGGTPLG
jgi:hypothetical protein